MHTLRGGTHAKGGFYWNLARWTIVSFDRGGGALPGPEEHRYVKVPALAMLALAPVMGGLYVMFLPFLGFALLFGAVGTKGLAVVRKAATAARELAWKRG